MTDIKEIARELKLKMQDPDDGRFDIADFATALLAELSRDAEPVATVVSLPRKHANGPKVDWHVGVTVRVGMKLYTHPRPVEAIEQRVAEACAKVVRDASFKIGQTSPYRDLVAEAADEIRNGEWRRHCEN